MVKIKDIALKAGVSIATVSHVINNTGRVGVETREKVLEVLEELDYKPNKIAKSLKIKKTSTIGVIAEDVTVFNTPEIIDGIHAYAEANDYSISLVNLRLFKRIGNDFSKQGNLKELISSVVNQLVGNQVEGIIYIGTHTRDITEKVPSLSIPIVYTYCYTSNKSDFSVNYNDEEAAFMATNHLIGAGHKRIALISGLIDSIPSHDRFKGYRSAIAKKGLMMEPSLVKNGDWEMESGYKCTLELLNQPIKPTGIIAMNDLMAAGAINAIKESGLRVPEDVSVIGFDNREFTNFFSPSISTIEIPLHEMGEKSMEILYNLINNKNSLTDKKLKLPCRFLKRESVHPFTSERSLFFH